MKTLCLCAAILGTCLVCISSAEAQIIKLYDFERYHRPNNPDRKPIANGAIVDINAMLRLELDKNQIAAKARQMASGAEVNAALLADLQVLLQNQVRIMQLLQTQPDAPDLEGLYELESLMEPYLEQIERSPQLRAFFNEAVQRYDVRYPRTRERRTQVARGDIPSRDAFILQEFAQLAKRLSTQIAGEIPTGQVRFMLSGTLHTARDNRPIKLSDDFDDYEAQFYTVPRWQLALTPDDKRMVEDIARLSDSLELLLQTKGTDLIAWLKTSVKSDDCLRSLTRNATEVVQFVEEQIPARAAQLKATVLRPVQVAAYLAEELGNMRNVTPATSGPDMLDDISRKIARSADSIQLLLSLMEQDLLSALDVKAAAEPVVQNTLRTFADCKDNLQQDLDNLYKIRRNLLNAFAGARTAAQAGHIIGDKVRRLPVDLIPDESVIDLRQTGMRTNGDQVSIRATLILEENGREIGKKRLEEVMFNLQQVGLYSIVKPMLLLANPLAQNANVRLERQYQFAPSYSLLFKWGSRRSKAFNQFWSPGFGFNFSSTDFDTNSVPEFGAALEFTFLRDYLATGLGYNFGADASFFFVGFRLPIASVPLPIFNNVDTPRN